MFVSPGTRAQRGFRVKAYHPFHITLSAGSQSTKYDSSQKRVAGQSYFNPANAKWGLTTKSTALFRMVLQTTNNANAAGGDLYYEPTSGTPATIATLSTTLSLTAVLLSVDVSQYFRSNARAAIFDARFWITTANGNDQATCTESWIEITP